MQMDLRCPVENQGVTVKTNSQTGEPYALFKLFNLSDRVISGLSFDVHAYDAYGGKLGEIRVDLQELAAQPKTYFAETKAVSLKDYAEAKHITADFLEVAFEDGDIYHKSGEVVDVEIVEPDYDEKIRLISAAGDDAECYAKDAGPYWVCVCGRPNLDGVSECVRCGRNKNEVFAKYSSRDALTKAIEEKEEAERLAAEQREEERKLAIAKRNQKIKKVSLITAGVVVALVILFFLVNLAYSGVMTLMGNRAQKSGDYMKAYSRYAAVGNDKKLAEVSENLRGNTMSNLMQTGFLTTDSENIYYIDFSYAIHKESKETGESVRLGDAEGVFVNVSDGWVYYVDAKLGNRICRIKTDGSATETIYEDQDGLFYYLSVVGNELYYVAQEMRDDLTPEMQEELAQQPNANPYQIRLYRLTLGEKTPERISEEEIAMYTTYKDRIYFLNQQEQAIYSMNRKGQDLKKVVSGPVYNFSVYNDAIYYVDGTPTGEQGMPKLSLEVAELDGTFRETKVGDKMVYTYNHDGDDIYYLVYGEETATLRKIGPDGETEVATGCQSLNVRDGYLMYLSQEGMFMKTKYDKSGFVPLELPEVAPAEEIPAE